MDANFAEDNVVYKLIIHILHVNYQLSEVIRAPIEDIVKEMKMKAPISCTKMGVINGQVV